MKLLLIASIVATSLFLHAYRLPALAAGQTMTGPPLKSHIITGADQTEKIPALAKEAGAILGSIFPSGRPR